MNYVEVVNGLMADNTRVFETIRNSIGDKIRVCSNDENTINVRYLNKKNVIVGEGDGWGTYSFNLTRDCFNEIDKPLSLKDAKDLVNADHSLSFISYDCNDYKSTMRWSTLIKSVLTRRDDWVEVPLDGKWYPEGGN